MSKRIGDVLISDGVLSEKTLARALELQAGTARGTKLGAILLRWDLVGERDLLRTLAKMHHCPAVDWTTLSRAEKSVTRLLSGAQAARLGALPYGTEGKGLRVAFTNPSNIAAVDEVQAITGRRVVPAVSSEVRMSQAHQRFYARPLSREMWTAVQKIESRQAADHPPARPIPARASQPTADAPDATQSDTACADVWLAEPSVSDADVDSLVAMLDENAPTDDSAAGLAAVEEPGASHGDLSAPDPLADDGPLSNFLEAAIHYYGSTSDLHEALAAMEMGPIEDLDASMFVEEEKRPGDPLDETHPPRRFRSQRTGEIAI